MGLVSYIFKQFLCPKTVTSPGTNQTQLSATMKIRDKALTIDKKGR